LAFLAAVVVCPGVAGRAVVSLYELVRTDYDSIVVSFLVSSLVGNKVLGSPAFNSHATIEAAWDCLNQGPKGEEGRQPQSIDLHVSSFYATCGNSGVKKNHEQMV
jgi:hypothetical protein